MPEDQAMSQPTFERLTGARMLEVLPDLARLRIEVFREFPYLYEGSQEYEQRYMRSYAENPQAVVIGCSIDGRLVGAATALPLKGEPESVRQPLAEAGYDVDRIFYFGESVLEKPYRGRGIGVRFFQEREAAARESGHYTHALFCAVVRPDDHPARRDYQPLDRFWHKRGFARIEGLNCWFSWKDVGDREETRKPMAYWIKAL
jgi:GNAT superfamily N-acetyltransferase